MSGGVAKSGGNNRGADVGASSGGGGEHKTERSQVLRKPRHRTGGLEW